VATSVALAETPSENASRAKARKNARVLKLLKSPKVVRCPLKRARQRWLRVACWKATERTGIRRSRMKKDDRLATTEMRARPSRTRAPDATTRSRPSRKEPTVADTNPSPPRAKRLPGENGLASPARHPARRERGAGELACRRRYRGNAGSAGPQDHLAHRRGHRDLERPGPWPRLACAPDCGCSGPSAADPRRAQRSMAGDASGACDEGKERLRAGQRPRVRPAGSGLYALARRPPDSDLERAEFVLGEARRALRERTLAALEQRLADLSPAAFEPWGEFSCSVRASARQPSSSGSKAPSILRP